jgi:hypothetical protein
MDIFTRRIIGFGIVTLGDNIAAVYFGLRSPLD